MQGSPSDCPYFFMSRNNYDKIHKKVLHYAKRHSIIYLGGEGMRIKIKAPKSVKCSIKVNLVVLQFELAFEY